jgi:hypothetical protein
MGTWDNAFKLPVSPEVTAEEKELLDALAQKARGRRMGDMAAMALESTRPLHHLGSQGVVFLGPMLGMIFQKEEVSRYARLLENPKAVSYLVERLGADPEKKF